VSPLNNVRSLAITLALLIFLISAASAACQIKMNINPSHGANVYLYDNSLPGWIVQGGAQDPYQVDVDCTHRYTAWVQLPNAIYFPKIPVEANLYPNDPRAIWKKTADGLKLESIKNLAQGADQLHWELEGSYIALGIDATKTADPVQGYPGDIITFPITVKNIGDISFGNSFDTVLVVDDLPAGLDYISSVATVGGNVISGIWNQAARTITWNNLGSLAPQVTIPITITARIRCTPGQMENKVVATGTKGATTLTDSASVIISALTGSLSITHHPSDVTECIGGKATFSVTASGTGTLTYQWQQSTDDDESWSNIEGETETSLILPSVTTTMSGYKYRVVVTGPCGSIPSNPATLVVNSVTLIITPPQDIGICEGSATFTVEAEGSNLNYQWEASTNGGSAWTVLSGETSNTLTIASVNINQNGYKYRAVVTGTCGSIISDPATLTVTLKPTVSIEVYEGI
jgi:uncharacterized repeat protein (TIGR01451 family)